MTIPLLPLENMSTRHFGLTSSLAECYLEAARVVLDRHHIAPQEFILHDNEEESKIEVKLQEADARVKAAWANLDDATRDGAYACALAATELARGLVAVSRAETKTGADYYIAPIGRTIEDLEDCLRLEVSGTDLDSSFVKTRLKTKVNQALKGNSNLPALATVVGFKAQMIMIQTAK